MMSEKIMVIVGPTGSGKTEAAIFLAQKFDGEVISADARAIYRGMEIGVAKPNLTERQGIKHWGFDLADPNERFTVADWKKYAEQKICSIQKRGKRAIVEGGTGLYVDALIFDYQFLAETKKTAAERKNLALKKDTDRVKMNTKFKIYGIKWEKEELKKRLEVRARKMMSEKLFRETKKLVARYGWDNQAMKSNIYRFAWEYLEGEISLEEALERAVRADWQLARRQLTWWRRNPAIVWLSLGQIKQLEW